MRILCLAVLSGLLIYSCKNDIPEDGTPPEISFTSPDVTHSFMNGDTMHVKFEVTDNMELNEVHFTITENGTEKFHIHEHVDSIHFSYHHNHIININDHTDIILHVEATDHKGNENALSRTFHVHP